MAFLRTCRAIVALLAIAVPLILIAGPLLYLLIAWDKLMRIDERRHRRRVAMWQELCGEGALVVVCAIMGVRVDVRLPPRPWPSAPFIVVSNHLGGFDGFLVTRLLRLLVGRADIRAVGKRQVASWPIIGRAWRELRWGFVARTGDRKDYSAVERCGVNAHADGAVAVIFPEGTVYVRGKERGGYAALAPPKSGGLKTLIRAMPGRPLCSVTIVWERAMHGQAGLFDGGIPLGRRVMVDTRFVEVAESEVEAWLAEEWRRKDAIIAAAT